MKTPICEICARTGNLCSGCSEKLQKGVISELEVKISQLLYQINEKHNITEARFKKALDLGKIVLILTDGDVGLLIGREGKVVSELSQTLGKKVRIAEFSGDVKKSIADILQPARLLGINRLYSGGNEITKIRISKAELRNLPVDINTLEKAFNSLIGTEVKISFE